MKLKPTAYPSLHLPTHVAKRSRRNCCLRTCPTRSGAANDGLSDDAEVRLHLFPRNPGAARQWLDACKMRRHATSDRVCGRHFTDNDYTRTFMDKGRFSTGRMSVDELQADPT